MPGQGFGWNFAQNWAAEPGGQGAGQAGQGQVYKGQQAADQAVRIFGSFGDNQGNETERHRSERQAKSQQYLYQFIPLRYFFIGNLAYLANV